jgi:hypothetical protein
MVYLRDGWVRRVMGYCGTWLEEIRAVMAREGTMLLGWVGRIIRGK